VAVYMDLAELYRKKIRSGELANGDRLPTETELSEEHGVSVSTVSRFVKVLKAEGLIHTGWSGTFVGPRPADPRVGATHNRTIHCASKPRCNNFLEVRQGVNLASIITQVKWVYRGSSSGLLYFCHQCAPDILAAEKRAGLR
jgi:DNA-binding GntR family transcriptional regulator